MTGADSSKCVLISEIRIPVREWIQFTFGNSAIHSAASMA